MNKKQYVQFSKRIVIAVIASEFALCFATLLLSCCGYDMSIGADVIRAHTPFAIVTFVAYSGNSAVEKWLVNRANAGGGAATQAGGSENSTNG